MNFRLFIDALSHSEMNELSQAIHERREAIARHYDEPLDKVEINLIEYGSWIEAIKHYRHRNGCDLMTAKVKVDDYRDTLRQKEIGHPKG